MLNVLVITIKTCSSTLFVQYITHLTIYFTIVGTESHCWTAAKARKPGQNVNKKEDKKKV